MAKVLTRSVLFLLVVVLVSSQDAGQRSYEAIETVQTRSHGRGHRRIGTEDINEHGCTRLLVSGDVPRPDRFITASSQWDRNHGSHRARIYRTLVGHSRGAWSARPNNIYQWLQFDLGQPRAVTGVVTKGRSQQAEQFVKSYKILYSDNGESWDVYPNGPGVDQIFQANFDTETPKVNMLDPPIEARYIRINPRTWHGHISMRADLLGCF